MNSLKCYLSQIFTRKCQKDNTYLCLKYQNSRLIQNCKLTWDIEGYVHISEWINEILVQSGLSWQRVKTETNQLFEKSNSVNSSKTELSAENGIRQRMSLKYTDKTGNTRSCHFTLTEMSSECHMSIRHNSLFRLPYDGSDLVIVIQVVDIDVSLH